MFVLVTAHYTPLLCTPSAPAEKQSMQLTLGTRTTCSLPMMTYVNTAQQVGRLLTLSVPSHNYTGDHSSYVFTKPMLGAGQTESTRK